MKYVLLTIAVVAALAAAVATTAQAGGDIPICDNGPCETSDPCGTISTPSGMAADQVLSYCTLEDGATLSYYDASRNPCRNKTVYAVGKGPFGNVLFKYRQQIAWCYNGTRITTFYRDRGPVTPPWHSNWSWQGNISSNCADACYGLAGGWSAKAKTQGHFKNCFTVVIYTRCSEAYPTIVQTAYANGNYTRDWWN